VSVVAFSVTAEVEDLQTGIIEYLGAIGFEGGNLELRYEGQTYGVKKAESTQRRIMLDDLERIDFKKRWFGGSTMSLVPARVDSFDDIPFARNGKMVLSVSREYRQAAVDFMAFVQTKLDFRGKKQGS
jgi:hypothetical protein